MQQNQIDFLFYSAPSLVLSLCLHYLVIQRRFCHRFCVLFALLANVAWSLGLAAKMCQRSGKLSPFCLHNRSLFLHSNSLRPSRHWVKWHDLRIFTKLKMLSPAGDTKGFIFAHAVVLLNTNRPRLRFTLIIVTSNRGLAWSCAQFACSVIHPCFKGPVCRIWWHLLVRLKIATNWTPLISLFSMVAANSGASVWFVSFGSLLKHVSAT